MNTLPTIPIANLTVSRLIVGGNPFSGNAHRPGDASREMRDYYTAERIKATLRACEAEGVNTFLGRGDAHIMRLLTEYWNEGGALQWIGQTAPEMASMADNVRRIADSGAKACYVHGGVADRMALAGELAQLREVLDLGRSLGLVMGLAGHRPDTHRQAVELDLGAQFHCCSLYNLVDTPETYVAADRDLMTEVARQLPAPVIGYKIMAAGRSDPEEAFRYAFSHLRGSDAVCVGFFLKHRPNEVRDAAELTRRFG